MIGMGERITVELPDKGVFKVNRIVELMGFGRREEFLKAAVKRTVDHYKVCNGRVL